MRGFTLTFVKKPYYITILEIKQVQGCLYGSLQEPKACKDKGVFVALSIDGTKKSGNDICELPMI